MQLAPVNLFSQGNKFLGINLDADAYTEHEIGVLPLKKALGIASLNAPWIENQSTDERFHDCYVVKEAFVCFQHEGHVVVAQYNSNVLSTANEMQRLYIRLANQLIGKHCNATLNGKPLPKGSIAGMWSDRGFMVCAKSNSKEASLLNELYEASQSKDLLLSGKVLDQASGLTFAKQSRLDRVGRARIRELKADLEAARQSDLTSA